MPFTENSFYRLTLPILDEAENAQMRILDALSDIAADIADDPSQTIRPGKTLGETRTAMSAFQAAATTWTNEELASAYRRGIETINGQVAKLGVETGDGEIGRQLFTRGFEPEQISEEILEDWPQHRDQFSVLRKSTLEEFEQMNFQVIRDVDDKIRELTIEASRDAYRNADQFTRRDISQRIMNRFSDEGINAITYRNGRQMPIDSYAEMVARNQSGNAARQGAWNRQQQLGEDLIRVSTHYPTSDLCAPYQGNVYSMSGNHPRYPAFSNTNPGAELFHSNCKHSIEPFYEGISPSQESQDIDKARNEEMYEAQKRQRTIERRIRKWKKRKASAITDSERLKARNKISDWQKQQRQHVEDNNFLRRQYQREAV